MTLTVFINYKSNQVWLRGLGIVIIYVFGSGAALVNQGVSPVCRDVQTAFS